MTLEEKIKSKEALIQKKFNTISTKLAKIEKLENQLKTLDETSNDYRYKKYDIDYLKEDIARAEKEIKLETITLNQYKEKLAIEEQKANDRNIPIVLEFLNSWKNKVIEFYSSSISRYFEEEVTLKQEVKLLQQRVRNSFEEGPYEEYKKLEAKLYAEIREMRSAFNKKYIGINHFIKDDYNKSLDYLEKEIEKEKNRKYDNLIARVTQITGPITNVNNLKIGHSGELNGTVDGKFGKAKVETIGAGGYNIQIYHFRTLVKSLN